MGASLQVDPVDHHRREAHIVKTAGHQLTQRDAGAFDGSTRDTADFDVERSVAVTVAATGSFVPR